MKPFSLVLLAPMMCAIGVASSEANGLRVETTRVETTSISSQAWVTVTVGWQNGWRNAKNHDAVWLFAKATPRLSATWSHPRIVTAGPASNSPVAMTCEISADRVGVFCAPSSTHRGAVSAQILLTLDLSQMSVGDRTSPDLAVMVLGIEMVYVPAGPFSVGTTDARSVEYAAFYRSNASGGHAGPYRITSEAAIRIAPEEGALFYQTKQPEYQGDRAGPLPAEFPKGTRAFFTMKYEILQGQYAVFLDTIGNEATFFRAINAGAGYYDERGTLRLERGRFVADKPDRPANWVSWDDGIAFADWAGLRPMTELEFVKAARGPIEPTGIDYPWGTTSKDRLRRRLGSDADLVSSGEADESRLTDDTRDVLGASFYWVMDLAGSVWEKVVSAGHAKGRAFRGTHGDGRLRAYGVATNEDWPSGDHDGGGYGYRGGGHYELARELARVDAPLALNPHSPIDWRNYAAWGGAPRSVAYGFRAVRTAER